MEEQYVSAAEIARRFKIPRTTLYRLAADKKITAKETTQAWHKRRHWQFKVSEVAAALARLSQR